MGAIGSKYNRTSPSVNNEGKVRFYSKENFEGNIYEIDYGNYTSNTFIYKITPDNVFSMSIPSNTELRVYAGDIYDLGGKGFMAITNVTPDLVDIPILPDNIRGNVRSLSITKITSDYLNATRNNTALHTHDLNADTANGISDISTIATVRNIPNLGINPNIATAPNIDSSYTADTLGIKDNNNFDTNTSNNSSSISTFDNVSRIENFNQNTNDNNLFEIFCLLILLLFIIILFKVLAQKN
jgi:hypothetical protein